MNNKGMEKHGTERLAADLGCSVDQAAAIAAAIMPQQCTPAACRCGCGKADKIAEDLANETTPGPWSVDGGCVAMGGQVVISTTAPDGASRSESLANARLIAAAPALLAACRDACQTLDPDMRRQDILALRDRILVALAEGGAK